MTQPGVGRITALATEVFLGEPLIIRSLIPMARPITLKTIWYKIFGLGD